MENDGNSRNCNLGPGYSSEDGGSLQQHSENVPVARPTTLFLPSGLQAEVGRRNSSTLDEVSSFVRVNNGLGASGIRVLRANSAPVMSNMHHPLFVASAHPSSSLSSHSPLAAQTEQFMCVSSATAVTPIAGSPTIAGFHPLPYLTTNGQRQGSYVSSASLTPITPTTIQPTTLISMMTGSTVVSPSPSCISTTSQQLNSPSSHSTWNNQPSASYHPNSQHHNFSTSNNLVTNQPALCKQTNPNPSVTDHVTPPITLPSSGFPFPVLSCPSNILTPVTPTTDITMQSHKDLQSLAPSRSLTTDYVNVRQPSGNIIAIDRIILSQCRAKQLESLQARPGTDGRSICEIKNTHPYTLAAGGSASSHINPAANHCMVSRNYPQVGPQGSATNKCLEWLHLSSTARTSTTSSTVSQTTIQNVPDSRLPACSVQYVPPSISVAHCSPMTTFDPVTAGNRVASRAGSVTLPYVGLPSVLNQAPNTLANALAPPELVSLVQLRSNSFPVYSCDKSLTVTTASEILRSPSIDSLDKTRCWSSFLQKELTPIHIPENPLNGDESIVGTSSGISENGNIDIGHLLQSPPNLVAASASSPKAGRLGVDLRLTMPCSPPIPESGDETAFSFQECETATLHDSDLDSVASDPSVDAGREGQERQGGTTTPPEHCVIGGILTDGDFDAASSFLIEDEPIFDEYEPVSDQDEAAVVELSDSDIDAGFAVTAAALAAAEADSQLSDEFADQSGVESDDGHDTDELDMAAFLIAFKNKEKRRRRYGSANGAAATLEDGLLVRSGTLQSRLSSGCSDSDHDVLPADRWRCLECNQLNNKSFFRYCEKCWKMRRGWLPDPPKKRRKRKPRNRAHRRRTTSTKTSATPPPDKDTTKGQSPLPGTSSQATDGGESSKSCTIALAQATSSNDALGSPGTSQQENQVTTCDVPHKACNEPTKMHPREEVVERTDEGDKQTVSDTKCLPCPSQDDTTGGQSSQIIVKNHPCVEDVDSPFVERCALSATLLVDGKMLDDSSVSIEPRASDSGQGTACKRTTPEASAKVGCTRDFVNYDSGINSCDGLTNACSSRLNNNTEALNAKVIHSSNYKAQSSQKFATADLSFDSNDGEDTVDGPSISSTLSACPDKESSTKCEVFIPSDVPSTSGRGSCSNGHPERHDPLKRLSLNESSTSLDSSIENLKERVHLQSIVQGSCETDTFSSPPSPSVNGKYSPSSNQNTNVQPASSECQLLIHNNISKPLIANNSINSLFCGFANDKSAKLAIANGQKSPGAGEGTGVVCSAERTLKKRTLSTASTVSLEKSIYSEIDSDSASIDDESISECNNIVSGPSMTSILEHNTLLSIKQHVDGIDAPVTAEFDGSIECKSLSSDQHTGADLDRFSTHSTTDSVSVIDSGLGSSQDLFQDSPLEGVDLEHNADELPINSSASRHPDKSESPKVEPRRRSKTSIYSKKMGGRKRSNSVLEIVDLFIENLSSGSELSSKQGDRGTKRKYSREGPCKRSPSAKRARKDNSPLKRYLTNGLLLNTDDVDVHSLSPTHSTRIIASTIAEFLRSKDAHSWLATDVGRSWVSSPSVQALLLASLTGSKSGETAGEGNSSKPVDVRTDNLCIMCEDRPKDTAIIHGKTSHQTTCYKCAKALFSRKQRCPVCRRKILRIAKNIIV